jgi:YbgC/YbaW family acyl-CoA thioester hydrolase
VDRFAIEHRVPWPDVDLVGVVYFARFLSYFEMAELEWMRARKIDYEGLLRRENIWLPRVSAHCEYRAPARLGDLLSIEMTLGRLGRSSFTLAYQAFRLPERKQLADGYIVAASVSRTSFKAVRLPKELRDVLQALEPVKKGKSKK